MKAKFLQKSNLIYVPLILLVTTLIFILLTKEEVDLKILSSKQLYSIYHTDNLETFKIEILTNKTNTYYFSNEYISTSHLKNEEQSLSVVIKDIKKNYNPISIDDEIYYKITFIVSLPLTANDYLIEMDQTNFEINYTNGKNISFQIGEFNYLYRTNLDLDIALNNLVPTHEMIDQIDTIGGVNLELSNLTNSNIEITDINILSAHTNFNKKYIIERNICEIAMTVEQCLGLENYNFYDSEYYNLSFLLQSNNNINLYLPLKYNTNYPYIDQFVIIVDYTINGVNKQYIVDDFPFINSSHYNTMKEDIYHEYTISDTNQ